MKRKKTKAAPPHRPDMVFRHEEKPHDRIAKRVIATIDELNAALEEAHKNAETRVELKFKRDEMPMRFHYNIYKLSHSVFMMSIATEEDGWKVVKDGFVKAAGQAMDALKKGK